MFEPNPNWNSGSFTPSLLFVWTDDNDVRSRYNEYPDESQFYGYKDTCDRLQLIMLVKQNIMKLNKGKTQPRLIPSQSVMLHHA